MIGSMFTGLVLLAMLGHQLTGAVNWNDFALIDDTCLVLVTVTGETTVKSFPGDTARSRCVRTESGRFVCTTTAQDPEVSFPGGRDAINTTMEVWGEDDSLLALHTDTRANRAFMYKEARTFVWTTFSLQESGDVFQKQCAGHIR